MKTYLNQREQVFGSNKRPYVMAQVEENWHYVYLESWPNLKLGPQANPMLNDTRNKLIANGNWKEVELDTEITN